MTVARQMDRQAGIDLGYAEAEWKPVLQVMKAYAPHEVNCFGRNSRRRRN